MMFLFWLFLKQELFCTKRSFGRILQAVLFFFVGLFVFFFLSQSLINQAVEPIQMKFLLLTNAIWFLLIFSLIFSNADFLSEDFHDGTLEQMIIACPNLEIFVLAKIIANWLAYSAPILFFIPLVILLFGFNMSTALDFAVLAAFASFGVNFICAFCGSLNIAANKAPLMAVLALPLLIPILLIACGANIVAPESHLAALYSSLKIILAMVLFVGSISTIAIAKIAKIICE